jgi:hypothetical protein
MSSADDKRQRLQAKTNRTIGSRIPRWAWDGVVSIVLSSKTILYQFATGTLFQVAGQRFIVTAAHSIRIAAEYHKTIGVTCDSNSFMSTSGDWICSEPFQYGSVEDPFDIAVYPIPNEFVRRFNRQRFIQLSEVRFDVLPSGVFVLFGYPGIWSVPSKSDDQKLKIKPFEYAAIHYGGDLSSINGYQPKLHFLLDADSKGISLSDGSRAKLRKSDGSRATFPRDLKGISGCPVWLAGDQRIAVEDWQSLPVGLAGVQTGVYQESGAIRVTRWIAVTTLIHEAFPELRCALRI